MSDIPIKTSTKEFCETITTSLARYEKYRCWASKLQLQEVKIEGGFGWGNLQKIGHQPAAKGVWQKEFGKKVTTKSDRSVRKNDQKFVPAIPQSEVLAKFLQETGEKCGEILAKFFADFCPSISRENGRKRFHEKSSTFSTVHQIKFFHCCNSGGFGAQQKRKNLMVTGQGYRLRKGSGELLRSFGPS